jgi:predicted RNA-binding protein YlxR (DUF448 family)
VGEKKKQQSRVKHTPQRTCIVCRQKFDKRHLTRIVRTPEMTVVVDSTGKKNGRGAYLCDQTACWDDVIQNIGLLNQALKTKVSEVDQEAIANYKPAATKIN